MPRGRLQTVKGTVVSDKMQKTIVVRSERKVKHPRYGKYVRRITTYYAHDEDDRALLGDDVELAATRPLSKLKRWRLVRVITRGGRPFSPAEGEAES
ncbi:MAG: 30S ribosomal protein S17 [Planctomycetota bacterium]|jgi:small subunit ribosomal protein S17